MYNKSLEAGKNLIKSFEIANAFYNELKLRLSKSPKAIDFKFITSELFNIIFENQLYGSHYYSEMKQRITHEWAMEIYWSVLGALESTDTDYSNLAMARTYIERIKSPSTPENEAKEFADDLRVLSEELKLATPYEDASHAKYLPFRKMFLALKEYTQKPDGLDIVDYFFHVRNYKRSPFCEKNLFNGITFTNFYTFISDYLKLHKKSDIFSAELSAFVLEKLNYGISYESCYLSFIENNYIRNEIPNNYWSTRCFCNLFDTHNISLTSYIIKEYCQEMGDFWSETNGQIVRYNTFFTFQLHNGFWLPLLYSVLIVTLDEFYESNPSRISSAVKKHIEHNIASDDFPTYHRILQNTHSTIERLNKVLSTSQSKSDILKKKILSPSSKNDRKEYLFSTKFSFCFYTKKTPNFIHQYLQHIHPTTPECNVPPPPRKIWSMATVRQFIYDLYYYEAQQYEESNSLINKNLF